MSKITWHQEKRKVADIIPSEYNPRQAGEKQVQDLTESLTKFNLAAPLIINKNNHMIGGHFRLKILKDKGIAEVDVRVPNRLLDNTEERQLNLRLNKNLADWDPAMLANFDEEMLMDVGFSAKELDDIFDLKDGATEPDEIPPVPKDTKTKLGDIFLLGEHRLMCGDSTKGKDVAALMDGQKADMIFTDPPYNVDYAGAGKETSEGIKNDNLPAEEFDIFIGQAFEIMYNIMKDGAVFYICSGWSSYPVFYSNIIRIGFYRAGVIIWVKNNASYGWNDYRYKHEWILVGKRKPKRIKAVSIMYGWKKGGHFFRDTRDEYDVWEVPRVHSADMMHPTQKPIWLVSKALANSSERGWIVTDLFGGVGSTLIACERLKRICYTMEFDPKYVDLMITRWQNHTGQKAHKVGQGSAKQHATTGKRAKV